MFRVAHIISDTPQFWHYHVTSISFNVFKLDRKNRSNTATISGNSVNIKGAMSLHTHARANENKLEKVGLSFSSSVEDFGRLFVSV